MLYYLSTFLQDLNIPGMGVFNYLTFRSGGAFITSLIITIIFGKYVIRFLQKKQMGEIVRDLGLEGQMQKKGTPTMGGLLILGAIVIPTLLFAKLNNVYILLLLFTTVWFGFVGFSDDYLKKIKGNKDGLSGKWKILAQVILGLCVGLTLYLSNDVVVVKKASVQKVTEIQKGEHYADDTVERSRIQRFGEKSTKSTIPFLKNNEFDYKWFVSFMGDKAQPFAWIVFVIAVIFITTAVSNGVNLTDGLDGLAAGTTAIVGVVLGILAYLSGNIFYADYLNIMYIPHSGEMVVFASAFIGATLGFLWYNSYPAQVFMGDTGSLALGGIIGVFAVLIRKELLLPILCGIFFMESLSVIIQVSYFKHSKKKYGEGRRIFLMTPFHHHYQKKGMPESRIVARFWIIALLLGTCALITLKLR